MGKTIKLRPSGGEKLKLKFPHFDALLGEVDEAITQKQLTFPSHPPRNYDWKEKSENNSP
jgi:hypothetical protein